jgi:hypothetical protein
VEVRGRKAERQKPGHENRERTTREVEGNRKREKGLRIRESNGGVRVIRIYCIHVWEYHNEPLLINICQ